MAVLGRVNKVSCGGRQPGKLAQAVGTSASGVCALLVSRFPSSRLQRSLREKVNQKGIAMPVTGVYRAESDESF